MFINVLVIVVSILFIGLGILFSSKGKSIKSYIGVMCLTMGIVSLIVFIVELVIALTTKTALSTGASSTTVFLTIILGITEIIVNGRSSNSIKYIKLGFYMIGIIVLLILSYLIFEIVSEVLKWNI